MATVNFTYDYPYLYTNKEKGRFTWYFSESRIRLNGCNTYFIQFHSTIPRCSHITCNIEIENTGSGSVLGTNWDFYIYRNSDGWYKVLTFELPSDGKYTIDTNISNYNISKLAVVPSSNPGSSCTWSITFEMTRLTLTETLEANTLSTGMYQYGVFTNRSGVENDLSEVFVNIGGTLQKATGIFANIDGETLSTPPVYSTYLKTQSETVVLYKFIPPTDGTYRIKRKRISGDHEIRLYSSTFSLFDDDYFYDRSFPLTGGSVYYITLTHYFTADESESYLHIFKEE